MKAKYWFLFSDIAALATVISLFTDFHPGFAAGLFFGSWMMGVREAVLAKTTATIGDITVNVSELSRTAKVDSTENSTSA